MRSYEVAYEAMLLDTYVQQPLRDVMDAIHKRPSPRAPGGTTSTAAGVHIKVDDRRRLRATLVTLARRQGLRVTTRWRWCTHRLADRCGLLWVAEKEDGAS